MVIPPTQPNHLFPPFTFFPLSTGGGAAAAAAAPLALLEDNYLISRCTCQSSLLWLLGPLLSWSPHSTLASPPSWHALPTCRSHPQSKYTCVWAETKTEKKQKKHTTKGEDQSGRQYSHPIGMKRQESNRRGCGTYNLRSPGSGSFPGGQNMPLEINAQPVLSEISLVVSRCVTFHLACWG